MKLILTLLKRRDGATAIEYAVIAGMIGLTIISAAAGVGTELSNIFTEVSTGFAKRGG